MIEVCNISKSFGQSDVIHDVSFTLDKGIVALFGVNGAGKSTIMNMITGILSADKGYVLIDKEDVSNSSYITRKKIGYLHEENPLYEDMYVKEYLEYISRLYCPLKKVKQQVEFVIERIGLTTEYKKKINTLSKGNKQRVGLAQALVHDPEILILDEPTNGFDPNQQLQMKELLLKLKETKTILFSTHHLQEVEDVASRYLILDKGKIVFDNHVENSSSINDLFYNLTK